MISALGPWTYCKQVFLGALKESRQHVPAELLVIIAGVLAGYWLGEGIKGPLVGGGATAVVTLGWLLVTEQYRLYKRQEAASAQWQEVTDRPLHEAKEHIAEAIRNLTDYRNDPVLQADPERLAGLVYRTAMLTDAKLSGMLIDSEHQKVVRDAPPLIARPANQMVEVDNHLTYWVEKLTSLKANLRPEHLRTEYRFSARGPSATEDTSSR